MFCPSWVNKFVITVAHALTAGPSSIIACVLLWKHPGRLGVYLLLGHGTQRQSHHKVVSRPTQNQIMAFQMALRSTPPSRLSCGLRFWMWNASLIFRSPFQRPRTVDATWNRLAGHGGNRSCTLEEGAKNQRSISHTKAQTATQSWRQCRTKRHLECHYLILCWPRYYFMVRLSSGSVC